MNYLALIHHPIQDKRGDLVTTSVTNMDIHDISRSCKTFGIENYFIVTPVEAQWELLEKILGHWDTHSQSLYNPDRKNALELVKVVPNFEDTLGFIKKAHGVDPWVIGTSAKSSPLPSVTVAKLQENPQERPILLVFGTGNGLHPLLNPLMHAQLPPLFGPGEYNHLSVRSAVAIYLSQIYGRSV